MAQFDVHVLDDGFALDCQSGLLDHLDTRFIVPLRPIALAPPPKDRLNPVFDVAGERMVMLTEFALAVFRRDMGPKVASLVTERDRIVAAIDLLVTGI